MANNYTTTTDCWDEVPESSYGSSTDTSYATALNSLITSASRLIDREFGRWDGFFYPTTDSVDWYYDGSGESEQEIDEFVSISAVAVSEGGSLSSSDYTSWTLNTDYLTLPYNASGKGRPINRLALSEYNGTKGAWFSYQKSVKVTGIPGYSSTPPGIVAQACKIQAVRWFMRAKQGWQNTGASESQGSMTFSELDADIKRLLHPLVLELS